MKMKLLSIILLLSFPAFALEKVQTSQTSPSATSDEDPRPFAGLLTGAYTSKDANDSSTEFGVVGGYQLLPVALGVEFSGSKYRDSDGSSKDKTNLLLEGTYHLGGDDIIQRYSYLGVGLGLIVRSSATDFTWAPIAGFDVPLSDTKEKHFSLGADVKYLFTNSTPTEGVAVNGALKYWF
jgi:hypothetical protein